MYSLWWPNHIVPAYVSKVAKNLLVVCENIARLYKCLILWRFEIRQKSNTLTHNHNCLIGTITFDVHPITPTSPRNILATIFKSILILFAFVFLCIFFFLSISCMVIWERERERERRNTQLYKLKHQFCYAEAHRCYTWLVGFSGWDGYLYLSLRIF